jgi:predicted SAM-dependent methyltransferase
VHWIEDGLPELSRVRAFGIQFEFILMSGVWMHLDGQERERSMPSIAELLRPSGVLALSLRHGTVPAGR